MKKILTQVIIGVCFDLGLPVRAVNILRVDKEIEAVFE